MVLRLSEFENLLREKLAIWLNSLVWFGADSMLALYYSLGLWLFGFTENYLLLIFIKINDFVHRFILDHKFVDFTILVVNFTILDC
jgi:hypothetical protein